MDDVESQLGTNFASKRRQTFHFIYFPVELQVNFEVFYRNLLLPLPVPSGIMPYFPTYFPIYLSADLNREKLVAFAVLVGCDYFPQGVRGVGEEKAKKLISTVNHRNLLERLFLTSHALQNEVKLKEFKQRRCLPKRKLSMLFLKRGKKRASRTLLLLSVRHV